MADNLVTGTMQIAGRSIGEAHSPYIIAELSGNHNQSFDKALALVQAAKEAGADAVKLQTYTADTITLDVDNDHFRVKGGTLWDGKTLHELYQSAYTPWDWQPKLKQAAQEAGMHCFSSPFDLTAVAFLEGLEVPAYKIASFELVDHILLKAVAKTGKPIIASTGMASLAEIDDAVGCLREHGARELALLKTNSAYPAPPSEMNLRTIPHLAQAFSLPTGLSDHSLGTAVPVAATALGACIIEKHLCLSRSEPGPDSDFSLEPDEFREMVDAVRAAHEALGSVCYEITPKQEASKIFRRSLFVSQAVKAGEIFDERNVRSVRPGNGLHTKHFDLVIGKYASRDIVAGTPLSWDLIASEKRN